MEATLQTCKRSHSKKLRPPQSRFQLEWNLLVTLVVHVNRSTLDVCSAKLKGHSSRASARALGGKHQLSLSLEQLFLRLCELKQILHRMSHVWWIQRGNGLSSHRWRLSSNSCCLRSHTWWNQRRKSCGFVAKALGLHILRPKSNSIHPKPNAIL